MNVYAVNGEGLQAGDLQLALRHRLLHELKVPLGGLHLRAAAVASGLEGRHRAAAVGEELIPVRVSGVGDVEEISAATIRRPGTDEKRHRCKFKAIKIYPLLASKDLAEEERSAQPSYKSKRSYAQDQIMTHKEIRNNCQKNRFNLAFLRTAVLLGNFL